MNKGASNKPVVGEKTYNIDERKAEARQSFTGRSLTESQFDEAWALSGIVAREIHRSGSFRDKLSDYAYAFARTERFDALKGEEIIRDIFKARYGKTMNKMREDLMSREAEIEPVIGDDALRHGRSVVDLIRGTATMPFYRAYDQTAIAMAGEHGITEAGAKEAMKAAFAAHEGRELYEVAKEAEAQYYRPTLKEKQDKPESRFQRRQNFSQL